MGITRRDKLLRLKLRRLEAVIKHKRRVAIEREAQRTMLNQLRAEIKADRKAA